MALSLFDLLIKKTKAEIYARGLEIAEAIGLPVSSWQPGDPTRSLFHLESDMLATLEEVVVGYVASGFLDYATGSWLKILAKQVFNVDVPAATKATTDVTLTNAGGGDYPGIVAGDLTFRSSVNGKTYTNTTGGNLGPLGTLTVTVVADEAGSASSAGVGEIDELVTTMLGVTCSNAAVAVGTDEQDEDTTRQQCRDKLGSLSPNGPKDAYRWCARNPDLTGTNAVTRVRVFSDSDTGDVTIYLAGAAGGVTEPVLSAVEAAIVENVTPLCITPTVLAANEVDVPVTYELWVYKGVNKTAGEVEADVAAALEALFASREIGGDIIPPATTGKLYKSLIESTIRGVYPDLAFRVSVTAPAADVSLTNSQVATLGTVTPTVHIVTGP